MTEEEVMKILSNIKYPGYSKSITDFKIIKSINFNGDRIELLLNLATKNESAKAKIYEDIQKEFKKIGKIIEIKTVQEQQQSTTVEQKYDVSGAKKRIAILSAKGGVGKSTFAVSLGTGLKREGYKVGLFDADIHGPNVPRMLGVNERASANEEKKIMPMYKNGIYSMSLGYVVDQETPVIWKGAMVSKAIVEMLEMTDWPDLDYFIVDLPPGTGDAALTIKQNMDLNEAIIVTTPSMLSISDALRTVDFFNQLGVNVNGFVENMAYFICDSCHNKLYPFGNVEPSLMENELGIPCLGVLPFDPAVEDAADNGTLTQLEDEEYFTTIKKIISSIESL
jgi:ATP-binding protein involved in chromosome partitioning